MNNETINIIQSSSTQESISDIENQLQQTLKIPLIEIKGILKKYGNVEQKQNTEKLYKIITMFFVIIIYLPIIICDIYYGYTDTSCVNEYPNELDVNMKMYLFISALVGISINFAYLYNITLITRKHTYDQNICVIIFPSIVIAIGSIFLVAWNTIGALIFWEMLYNTGICNRHTSTYLFITLILKIIGHTYLVFQMKK
jgi:hypothetical protein